MRKFILPIIALVFALSLLGFVSTSHAQDVEVVCSAPADGATVDILPEAVSVTLSVEAEADGTIMYVRNEATGARVDVNGNEPTVEGSTVGVELRTAVDENTPVALEAGATYEVLALVSTADGSSRVSLTFTVSEDATEVGAAETDCPTEEGEPTEAVVEEEPTEAATEEPTEAVVEEEPTEAATEEPTEAVVEEEPTEAATEEPTEAVVEEEPTETSLGDFAEYEAGSLTLSIAGPKDYVGETNDQLFILPVTVFAADEETVAAYLDSPDSVDDFVVIFTTFSTSDLPSFGLTEDADANAIIDALVRPDSNLAEPEETEVAGAPALSVNFTNDTSGKAGQFYLVSFASGDYLLLQGSAAQDSWEEYTGTMQTLITNVSVVE